jgi:DNA repair exonuclease SbcCD nuclease subunit
MLYNLLARHFKNDKRIQFQIPTGFDTVYKVYGVNYLLTHGDRLGVAGGTGIVGMLGPIARGVQKIKQEYNNQNKTIDYVIMGHYHQYISLKGCIVNGSTKGYDEYAYSNRFTSERPQQALWFTHPEYGVTFQVPVVVDEPIKKKSKDWVSWSV